MTRRIAEAFAFGLALTLANAAAAETVKIGVIGTYSGGYARWGEQFKQAIAVYQKQPEMAKLFHEPEMTETNPKGFGCLECHQMKK